MKSLVFIFLIFTALASKAQETFSITGTVKDEKGAPVSGATIFLSGSKRLTATNGSGQFSLDQLPSGTYELVVKMLGYHPFIQNTTIQQKSAELNITLKINALELNEVVIKGRSQEATDPDRPKYLELFKQYFIGKLSNAGRSTITNPDVIKLHYNSDKGILEASSNEFLVIENAGLGYKINYLLKNFKLDLNRFTLSYEGSQYFEDLNGSAALQKRWETNRQLTYEGSPMHFFRTLFTNSTEAEGFLIYRFPEGQDLKKIGKAELSAIKPVSPASLFSVVDNDFKLLKSATGLHVVYTRETEPNWFMDLGEHIGFPVKLPSKKIQVSRLTPLLDKIVVDRNGGFPPSGFLFNGYWSLERIPDLMPLDYVSTSSISNPDPAGISSPALAAEVKELVAAVDTFRSKVPIEKVHVHFDKPYYAIGDTIWMKVYVVNGEKNEPSELSRIVNIDLIDERDSVKTSLRLPLTDGLAWGDITLANKLLEGNYRIRAYTNWMRNFGEEYFFDKTIPIGNSVSNSVVTNATYSSSKTGDTETMTADIRYTSLGGIAFAGKEVSYEVQLDDRSIRKGKDVTDSRGNLKIAFVNNQPLTKSGEITTILKIDNKQTVVKTIPVKSTSSAIDVQFFPESGQLVENVPSKVAVKTLGADGLGVNLSGYVSDKYNNKIAEFKTEHAGMGVFALNPLEGNGYKAVVKFADGSEKSFDLPKAAKKGYILALDNSGEESVRVRISVSPQVLQDGGDIILVAKTNNTVHYIAKTKLQNQVLNASISKDRFPTGIAQFTLMTADYQPVAERLVFIRQMADDQLTMNISAGKASYSPREKVTMSLEVADLREKSNFSVSVTDMSKVPADENSETTILSNLLLSSDLKGYIEKPNYYFTDTSQSKAAQLDLLMLTQGWRRFQWKAIRENVLPPIIFKPEQDITISGTVLSGTNSVAGGKVTLFTTGGNGLLRDTLTNAEGRFSFEDLVFIDSTKFVVQARTEKGGANVIVKLDSIIAQPVSRNKNSAEVQINVNSTLIPYLQNSLKSYTEMQKYGLIKNTDIMLEEVKITEKKIGVANSSNMNLSSKGFTPYNYILTAKDIGGGAFLADALYGKVPGLQIKSGMAYSHRNVGQIFSKTPDYFIPMLVIVDGVTIQEPAERDSMKKELEIHPWKSTITALNAVNPYDVETVEILSSPAKTAIYGREGFSGVILITTKRFTEVTSLVKPDAPGVISFKPKGYYIGREFYSPVYSPGANSPMADLRTTIYWNPNLVPDADGKVSLEFFTSDSPGTYRAVVEGLDYSGKLGRKVYTYTVNK